MSSFLAHGAAPGELNVSFISQKAPAGLATRLIAVAPLAAMGGYATRSYAVALLAAGGEEHATRLDAVALLAAMGGYATRYATPHNFTFITVRGGRHEVPETAPLQAYEMLRRLIAGESF